MRYFLYCVIWALFLAVVIWTGVDCYKFTFDYKMDVKSYLQLADDASTAKLKLEYLQKYKANATKLVKGENARLFWIQPQQKVSYQMLTLDSLIDRVQKTSEMDEKSLEYQQAMSQITDQEFESAMNSIDDVFFNAYVRQNGVWSYFHSKWITGGFWSLIALIIACILSYAVYQKFEYGY